MPLLQEYPQGYWEGNQFILPTLPPPPQVSQTPVATAAPALSPLLEARPLLPQYGDGGDVGIDPAGPGQPSAPFSFSVSNPFGTYDAATNYGRAASLLGLATGVPAFGPLGRGIGTAMDISKFEGELGKTYPGYNPDLSFLGAYFGVDPPAEQAMAEARAMQDFFSYEQTSPAAIQAMIDQAEAEEAWAGFEGSFDPFSPGGWSTPGEDPGGPGDDAGDDKIACTMMNHLYGFGSFRNAVWMRYARDHMPEPEWELGYHKVYGPLVKMMPAHPWVRKFMRWFARTRTATLRRELRGKRPTFIQAARRVVSRPIVYAVGWLVKRGFIEPADKESIKREIENANICL